MTYTKARGTFINYGGLDTNDPRWFILDSEQPSRVAVYYSESNRDSAWNNGNPAPLSVSGALSPKSWYNIEEEEPVSEFKVGDRVKVEYEGYVKYKSPSGGLDLVNSPDDIDSDIHIASVIIRPKATATVTQLAPPLPTKLGSVIDSHGFRFMLTRGGWHTTTDQKPYRRGEFEKSMYAQNFTVVLEGK
jgi:hypothetical protein